MDGAGDDENPEEQLYRLVGQKGLAVDHHAPPYNNNITTFEGRGRGRGLLLNTTTHGMQQSFCTSNSFYNNYPGFGLESLLDMDMDMDMDTPPPPYPYPHPHDRAVAALKNHKEAEKRRRERINSHLDNLRALLPCSSKTDKATLLGKVVERVRELKEETSEMREVELESLPSESDEVSVVEYNTSSSSSSNSISSMQMFKASLCCEDRSDLIPDLIHILKSLRLKPLRSEIATLGGRLRNVLLLAADADATDAHHHDPQSLHFLHTAFNSLLQPPSNSSSHSSKRRRRTTSLHLTPH